jgi:Uma2 family endonuclease
MGEPSFKLDLEQRYTYADYLTWPDDFRCELIDGKIYMMSPVPNLSHQDVAGEVFFQLKQQLKGKTCRPMIAPLDVRLPKFGRKRDDEDTVVQPDVLVVCDPSKLNERGVKGAPDWVIEVLSPSTASKDHIQKRRSYEQAGVREYWLLHPLDHILTLYVLQDGCFAAPEILEMKGKTASVILPDVEIDWDELPPPLAVAE